MVLKHRNRAPRPKTFCPRCKQRGIVVVKLPDGRSMCFRCIHTHEPTVYQNIVNWVNEHPPVTQG